MTNKLERITTEYVDLEDRVRLTGEIGNDEHEVIWLTQRLIRRLVAELVEWLERCDDDAMHAEALHDFAQQAAWAAMTPQAPIRPGDTCRTWLARSIEMASSDQIVQLTFKGPDDQGASLTLNDRSLRQWLNVLQGTYIKAGWSLDGWPDWIRDGIRPVHSPVAVLH